VSETAFNRGAVRPVECFREGWQLIKNDYWLFLGIAIVGVLIGSVGPMGILAGPMMCGIHICLLRHMKGRPIQFSMLFEGFNYFIPGMIVALVMMVPVLLLILLMYVGFFAAGLSFVLLLPQGGGPPDLAAVGIPLAIYALVMVAAIAVSLLVGAVFFFVYPLIVDRELSAFAAISTSLKAALANLGGVLGFVLLVTLLNLVGVLMCYFGLLLLLPLHYAAVTMAYRQVFPARAIVDVEDFAPEEEPEPAPPALDAGPASTDIRSERL
jgi:hypothetical protein